MFNPIRIILTLIVVGALGGASYRTYQQNKDESVIQEASQQVEQVASEVGQVLESSKQITVAKDGKTISYDGVEGRTALQTLKNSLEIETKDTGFGEFVEGINGIKAQAEKEYWALYINGKMVTEGAGTYVQKAGDKVEWRLEKL